MRLNGRSGTAVEHFSHGARASRRSLARFTSSQDLKYRQLLGTARTGLNVAKYGLRCMRGGRNVPCLIYTFDDPLYLRIEFVDHAYLVSLMPT
jgi:hypothetical protein